jgi:hypothetical protein
MINSGENYIDIPFQKFATPASMFMHEVRRVNENGMLNVDIEDAIKRQESYTSLVKVIKKAIAKHRRYAAQFGASPLHHGIVLASWAILGALYASHPTKNDGVNEQ